MKRILILILSIFVIGIVFSRPNDVSGQTAKKKKLYIQTIKADGVSKEMVRKMHDGISLSILNNFGAQYHIVDDEAIKVMYKQAEAIMSSGCSDESCVEQIAEGINADEIIFGTVSAEGGKLNLIVKNMYRKGDKMGLNSQVNLSFYETQIDHFASEAGKKLMNLNYVLNMNAPLIADGKVNLSAITVDTVKGLDISIMKFQSRNDIIGQMLDYLKELVTKGDNRFKANDFSGALSEYNAVLERIKLKVLPEDQVQMTEFTNGVKKRIGTAYAMDFKIKIDKVDQRLKDKGTGEAKSVESFKIEYSTLINSINNIPSEISLYLNDVKAALVQRQEELSLALASLYEKQGDTFYHEYKFDDAISLYAKGKSASEAIITVQKKNITLYRLNGKIAAANATGTSYLESRMNSYLDIAKYHNLRDDSGKAREALAKAKDILENSRFTTPAMKAQYSKMAKLIGGSTEIYNREQPSDDSGTKPALDGKTYKIGDRGSAGGWIFYDKGNYSDGWRYLESAPEDLSDKIQWYNGEHEETGVTTGATGTAIGTGKLNTQKIIAVQGKGKYAAKICADYRGGNKSDWFLPSKDELDQMYKVLHRVGVGGFVEGHYWSSSENGAFNAWDQYFDIGIQYDFSKVRYTRVRAVRAF
jgi:hypothetical protein